nr:uncharacterized protein LOC111510479 [Leptinotarsa decemlineata]
MKVLLIVAVVVLAAAAEDVDESKLVPLPEEIGKLLTVKQECAKKIAISEETLKKLETDEFPVTDETEAQARCFLEGIGILNDEGKFDKEGFVLSLESLIPEDKIQEIVDKCYDEEGTALELSKCVKQELDAIASG